MAYDGLRWHAIGSVSGSKNETEHLEDAPHYESHRRYDGMRYRVEQHEEKAKYDHSTFDFYDSTWGLSRSPILPTKLLIFSEICKFQALFLSR